MNFDFITDPRFKELLISDFQELKNCLDNKSSKAVLILSGSIIEACLVEYFLQNLPNGKSESDILKLPLGNLIEISESVGLLTKTEKNLASVIQDYRNLIHPSRQIRKEEKYDFETASIAYSLVSIVLKAIEKKQKAIIHFTAMEVIEKLRNDWGYRKIYDKMILKLKPLERNKLFDTLLIFEVREKEQWNAFMSEGYIPEYDEYDLQNVKSLIIPLIPLLEPEFLDYNLNRLLLEVQKGEKLHAFALFNLLHEKIGVLKEEDREMIAIYFLFSASNLFQNFHSLSKENTFSTIGNYIKTSEGLESFFNFTVRCIVEFEEINLNSQMNVFLQALNSLDKVQKSKVIDFALKFILSVGKPPINVMNGFIKGAVQKGLIDESSLIYDDEL